MAGPATNPWALAVVVLAAACAPTGVEEREPTALEEEPVPVHVITRYEGATRAPRIAAPFDDGCGALVVESHSGWIYDGPWLEAVRRGWHPRAEHGRPFAIREAKSPFEVPGRRLWQVQVDGAPQDLQPCFMPEDGPDPDMAHLACVPAWQLVGQATPEARPRTNAQWAQLLGLLDGATAVYPDEAAIDRCFGPLPASVRERVPSLGLRTLGADVEARFVERIDVGSELVMLVAVRATLADGRLEVERHEVWSMEQEAGR